MRQAGDPLLILPHHRIQPWTSGPGSSGLWPSLPVCLALAFSPHGRGQQLLWCGGTRRSGKAAVPGSSGGAALHPLWPWRQRQQQPGPVQYIWEMGDDKLDPTQVHVGLWQCARRALGSTGELSINGSSGGPGM